MDGWMKFIDDANSELVPELSFGERCMILLFIYI